MKNPTNLPFRPSPAFTLIELLVVIAAIGVFVSVVGVALGGVGNKSLLIRNAQGTVTSMLSGVRAQAALKGADAALFVNAAPSAEDEAFLREFRIAWRNGTNWEVVGERTLLPAGICVVPDAAGAFSEVTYGTTTTNSVATDWSGLYSTAFDNSATTLRDGNGNLPDNYRLLVRLTPRGTKSTATGGQLVLAPAERTGATDLRFANPQAVRGHKISNYGVTTPINDPDGFR